ncbi:MAG: BCD family MFS transporter [Roseiflexaceae bacterium]
MRTTQIIRLSAVHIAVALTLLPIDSTLNRIMISELGIPASLVALLIAVPYLFSPMQMWIGALSERAPLWGWRRSPYIMIGLIMCAGGAAMSPQAAFAIHEGLWWGIPLGFAAFGAWGLGFNFATVSYLSLATELSGPGQRTKVVGIMWFSLILSMIIGGIFFARSIDPYTHERLIYSFYMICGIALGVGTIGVIGLEPRFRETVVEHKLSMRATWQLMSRNPQAKYFFGYLIILLIAILGQDVLLEPYAADIFGVPPAETTRYTSFWGMAFLVALLITSPLTNRFGLKPIAGAGAIIAASGLATIILAGVLNRVELLVPGLAVFGFGAGLSTATNLALMFDMTVAGQVGVFIGAWGVADALARLSGTVLSGVIRDVIVYGLGSKLGGYALVFLIEMLLLVISVFMLRHIHVDMFQQKALRTADVVGFAGETQS